MKKLLLCLIACTCVSTSAMAADKDKKAAPAPAKRPAASSEVNISNGTDVIGSQDAPLVLNIVPWKDKESALPKNPLTASVLQEALEPIDRDVVHREVDFSRALRESPASSPKP